jgi:hypothetical protein
MKERCRYDTQRPHRKISNSIVESELQGFSLWNRFWDMLKPAEKALAG